MLVSKKNRLETAISAVRPRIEAHIAWLEQELNDLDEGLRQTLRRSPVWREKDDLLRTVPGVGEQVSLTLLAYLPEMGTLDRRPEPAEGGPGMSGSLQPGQRHPARQTGRLGRARPSTGHFVYGSDGSQPSQPGHPRLLPAAAGSRQAEEGGSRRVHAQTAGHTQLHAQTRLPVVRYDTARSRSFLLTSKTVATGADPNAGCRKEPVCVRGYWGPPPGRLHSSCAWGSAVSGCSRTVSVTVEPHPGVDEISTLPPWARATSAAWGKPRPAPWLSPCFVV